MLQSATDHELADVVIAASTKDTPFVPWYVTMRPWLFCLAFLLVAELATRVYFDTTICLQKERFDNYPTPASENAFVAQMQRDTAYKVVTIGDSTVVGAALLKPNQSMPRYLEESLRGALPGREIHVWNFSIAGARPPDMLCLLKKALEGKPDLIVVNGNYYISAMMKMPELHPDGPAKTLTPLVMAEPWLAYNLPAIPDSVRPFLPPREFKKRVEEELTWAIEGKSRFIGMRQAINARVFGVQPRFPYIIANPVIMTAATVGKKMGKLRPTRWDLRDLESKRRMDEYYYRGEITPQDEGLRFYRAIIEEARRSGLPCITYLTPQNPAFTRHLFDSDYRRNRHALSEALSGPGVANQDYSTGLVAQDLFSDSVHLLPEGNRLLASKIAEQILPFLHEGARTAGRQGPGYLPHDGISLHLAR
jgi:hypothetical protein